MLVEADIQYVPAYPGYEVLIYKGNSQYETLPVVAWAILRDENGIVRAVPVTVGSSFSVEEDSYVWFPTGAVTCGEDEYYEDLADWIAEMDKRGVPDSHPVEPTSVPANVVSLSIDKHLRNKLRQRDADL